MDSTTAGYYANYDWFGFSFQIITIILLFFALRTIRKLRERITGEAKELEEYRIAKGNYENEINTSFFSTSLQVLVACVNSFTNQEEVKKIADILYNANIIIPNCKKIGLSEAIIASMLSRYYAEKLVEQDIILDKIYPEKKDATENKIE